MEIIASGRQTGKTTRLMKASHEANLNGELAYMVVHSHAEAYRIARDAERMGLIGFRFPLTYDEFIYGRGANRGEVYIDNTEMLLQRLAMGASVVAISILQ